MLPLHYKTLGILEGIEPSVSFKNKDVFPLHYKIWGVGVLGGFEPPLFMLKVECDTITLQDFIVLLDTHLRLRVKYEIQFFFNK